MASITMIEKKTLFKIDKNNMIVENIKNNVVAHGTVFTNHLILATVEG